MMSLLYLLGFIFVVIASAVKILPECEKGVILRFGRSIGVKGPGLIILIPGVDKLLRVDTRTITMDIKPQDVITFDNVSMKVNAVIYFRVIEPEKSVTQVEDFFFATSQLAQTTLRSVLGQYQMDDLLSSRDKINHTLQEILDKATEPWGIKVSVVEVKHIDLPKEMRAKVINAEGEFQRAEKLKQASQIISQSPAALQLAYLQALQEVTGEGKNTVILPIPIDLVKPFMETIGSNQS